MRYLGWLFPAFFIAEIVSIVVLSQWLGGWTLVLMALQFFIGLFLLRNLGFFQCVGGRQQQARRVALPIDVAHPLHRRRPFVAEPWLCVHRICRRFDVAQRLSPKTGITAAHTQQAYQQYKKQRNSADGDTCPSLRVISMRSSPTSNALSALSLNLLP